MQKIYRGWFFSKQGELLKACKDQEIIIGTYEEIRRAIDEREFERLKNED